MAVGHPVPAPRPCSAAGALPALWDKKHTTYAKQQRNYRASGGQSSCEDDGGGGALSACLGTSLGVSAIALCEFWLAMTVRSHLTELVDGISLIVFQSCGTY